METSTEAVKVFEGDINHVYPSAWHYLRKAGIFDKSRAGIVLVAPNPVLTIYRQPKCKILFDKKRDANPFFHVFEAMWMLAGRNDAAWLDQYVQDFSGRYAELDGTLHGAYGARWYDNDQLFTVISKLRDNPSDRRLVLAHWDAARDLGTNARDIPCNTHIYFNTRPGDATKRILDMTVCCRSNDMIWGAYGSNVVHFSFLHEFISLMTDLEQGTYYQFSNNFHAYTSEMARIHAPDRNIHGPYNVGSIRSLMTPNELERREEFLGKISKWTTLPDGHYDFEFISTVLVPMHAAWQMHKKKEYIAAMRAVTLIASPDLQLACGEWINRRAKRHDIRTA